jgi:hypothetical protein
VCLLCPILHVHSELDIMLLSIVPRAMIGYNYVSTATYDVQSAAADTTKGTNNKIKLTGEFIENTTAQGCFVVLQCEYRNPDVFRALLLPDDFSTSVQSTIHDVISSTYNMLVYDLEEDGLPNSHPAVEQNTTVTVARNGPIADAESQFLKNGSLYWNETAVTIRCEFKEGIEGASCVLVYREYGNKTLVVEEYPQNTVFPVTLTVDGDQYTFAVFGKSSFDLEERPIVTRAVKITRTSTTTPQTEVTTSDEEKIVDTQVVAISIGTALAGVMICLTAVLVLLVVVRQCHAHRKKQSAVPVTVYDEVVLPLTTTSSIPTEPSHTTTIPTTGNVAYETTTPINTAHNVAYETHRIQST